MSVDVLRSERGRASLSRALPRVVPLAATLSALVGASIALRLVGALARPTPRAFPDEYLYAALSRSLAHGSLAIRGAQAHFPALLEPLLTAPFARIGDVELAYRLTQGLNAVAVSLAALPVYALARRLGLRPWQRWACAALTLAMPTLVYSAFVTADAVAFPLALTAIYAAVVAIETPTRRAQVAFLVVASLATFARMQYVVLFVAFAFAAFMWSSPRRPGLFLRRYGTTLTVLGVALLAVTVFGLQRALGYYGGTAHIHASPQAIGRWVASNLMLLAFLTGFSLVPAALAGLRVALGSRRSYERGFAWIATSVSALLLLEAAIVEAANAARDRGALQERYLMVIPPLLAIACFVWTRVAVSRASRVFVGAGYLAMFALAAWMPLSDYTTPPARQDSPFLQAVFQLCQHIGPGNGLLAVSLIGAVSALVGASVLKSPSTGAALAVAIAIAAGVAASVGAVYYERVHSGAARATFLPSDEQWVDHAHLGNADVLVLDRSASSAVEEHFFWNSSLKGLLLLPGSSRPDRFGSSTVAIANDGRILTNGHAVVRPLLIEELASVATLDGASLVQRTLETSLWRPRGVPRLATLTAGRYLDGWLGGLGDVTVWPKVDGPRRGVLLLRLSLPAGMPATTLDLKGPGVRQTVRVTPGSPRRLEIPADVRDPWHIQIRARNPFFAADGRILSVQMSRPIFVEKS